MHAVYMGLGFGGVAIAAIAKVVLGHIVTRRLTYRGAMLGFQLLSKYHVRCHQLRDTITRVSDIMALYIYIYMYVWVARLFSGSG